MSGLLALAGGREHTARCEPLDSYLLEATNSAAPVISVVTLASSMRNGPRAAELAIQWWERLGATVLVAPPEPARAIEAIDRADIIVLTGGVPDRLYRRLLGSPVFPRIVERWMQGVHLSGSSSGAMVLAGWRQSIRLPFGIVRGFGVLPSIAVFPHHDLTSMRAVASVRARTHPHLTMLGIDECTGLIGHPPGFEVVGPGKVTVRRGPWERTLHAGDRLELPYEAEAQPRTVIAREHAHDLLRERGLDGPGATPQAFSKHRDGPGSSTRGLR